jgi:hypothetical protein
MFTSPYHVLVTDQNRVWVKPQYDTTTSSHAELHQKNTHILNAAVMLPQRYTVFTKKYSKDKNTVPAGSPDAAFCQ